MICSIPTLTDYMSKMGIQSFHSNPPTSRISFATEDELFRLPEEEEMDQEHERWKQHLDSEIAGLRSTAESTKEDTTKLLNKADEQMEAAGMHHEDTMLGQDEIKGLVEEGQVEILDALSLQHEESSQQLSSILQVVTMLKESQEGAKKKGNVAEVMKLERKIVELQKTIDNLRQSIIKERKENKELKHELNLAKTPQKPRRGLAPVPSNRQPIPATKRMVVAEMKHVGLKSDTALVGAEGVKRGNSSTLLP